MVVRQELVALGLHEIVPVGAFGGVTQSAADHLVARELFGGVQQRRRQRLDALGRDRLS